MGTQAELRGGVPSSLRLPARYEPVRLIAAGATASVWCAEDQLLSRRVAIKLLAEPYASDPDARRRFKREARAAARLSAHPHVATIFDVGETEVGHGPDGQSRPFIVMEHLPGGTVADALRCRAVSSEEAVRWLHEAASAIDYAHSMGILHRDIKPANLLLDRGRGLHVADFGIAQIGREETITNAGEVLGTASYLAPERVLGRPATQASDLYSLAVAAFELLTGERPFTATSYLAQARQHLEAPPPEASLRDPDLPPAVDAVLARGMAKDPGDRWASAEEFATAVERAVAPSDSLATTRTAALARGRRAAAAGGFGRGARRSSPARGARKAAKIAAPAAAAAAATAAAASAADAAPRPRPEPFPPGRNRTARSAGGAGSAGSAGSAAETRKRGTRARVLALTAAAVVAIGVAVALAFSGGSSHHPATSRVSAPRIGSPAALPGKRTPKPAHRPKPKPTAPTHTTATTTTSTATEIEARGHSLLASGDPAAAVPVLRQALVAAPSGSPTYAYALFDLGRALRLSGDPRAAVPILVQRLKIPNQTATVRAELTLALEALGQQASRHSAPAPAPAPGPPGHAKGHGKDKPGHGPPAGSGTHD